MTLSEAILTSRLNRPFKYFESIGSTNDVAKSWLETGAPDGAVVVANQQTHGRGRKGRAWQTPPDVALAVSVILRPPARLVWQVNQLGALAVYDLAAELGCTEVGIKWPNDVQAHGKKFAGILPEVAWQGPEALGVVLGIGLNVRLDFNGTELSDSATSLQSVAHSQLDRADLLQSLLRFIDYWYSHIDDDILFASWKRRLSTLGKRISVEEVIGVATDVKPDGSLLLRDDFGVLQNIQAGDVFVVDIPGEGA